MLAVSASCSLLTLPYQHHNLSPCSCLLLSFFFFPVFFSLSSSSFFLSSPVSLLLLPLSSSPVFFPCLLLLFFPFFSWVLLLLLAPASMSGPRASRKSAADSCTCSCARSFPDHRRLHSSRCMQTHQLFADDRLVARYAQNLFTARISQLLGHCFRALYTLS